MDEHVIQKVVRWWDQGRVLDAGALVYGHLPPAFRPGWAANALELACSRFDRIAEVDDVLEIARNPRRWRKGSPAFSAVRALTLQEERRRRSGGAAAPLLDCILPLAENTAKVTANAAGGAFDGDCGAWVAVCLYEFAQALGRPEFTMQAREVVCLCKPPPLRPAPDQWGACPDPTRVTRPWWRFR